MTLVHAISKATTPAASCQASGAGEPAASESLVDSRSESMDSWDSFDDGVLDQPSDPVGASA